jgi:glycosyltransferase involved in cell wall biosynthesis
MTAPLRVMYDISPQTLGGTERFLSRLLTRLDRRRFEPVVVSRRDGPPLQMIRSAGITTCVVPAFDSKRGVQQVGELLRRQRIGLTQSNYYSFTLALASSAGGVPHIWRPGGHVSWGSGIRSGRDARVALEMMDLLSAMIVCNSAFVAAQFRSRLRTPARVIPNGIALAPTSATSSSRSRRLPAGGRFRIGMVAHLTPQKRHGDFVRAAHRVAAKHDDVEFVIYGRPVSAPGSRVYASSMRHAARELSRNGRFTFSAFEPSDGNAFPDLDVLVLPSVGESFSNALLEGMAAGLPVIAARSGGNPEIVVHGSTGLLVEPKRSRALADAMMALISNPLRMRSMGRAGRARIRKEFSLGVCVRRYQRAYTQVVAGR